MSDVFAELDEVVRQERAERFWKENGRSLVAAVLATIVLTGAISGWRTWNAGVQEKQTDKLLTALDTKEPAEGLVKVADDLRPGLRGVALLNAGSSYIAQGKKEEAIKIYQKAAADKLIPSDLRELAALMEVNLTQASAENKDALLGKLSAIASDEKSPWRYHARLQAATILAHTAGDYAGAQAQLKPVIDATEIAPSIKAKAQALSQVYAIEAKQADAQP